MKRLLLFISTLLCANVLMAQTTFWIRNIQYQVTSTNPAEVEVNHANSSIVIADIPATVSYEGINYSVISIGEDAFYRCDDLFDVTIPNSVTSISSNAFSDCSRLTSITIPNSVTSIGEMAFYNCSSLIYVTIPNSVTSIGEWAFYNCSSITSVNIPNSVTSIGYGTFYRCDDLFSVTIPNSVTFIGSRAFSDCSRLTSITIPNSVTSIGNYAFSNCSRLTSITIPNSVTSIGYWAFQGCSSLTSITIPNSVTSIRTGAFSNCSRLTSVTIPNSVTFIGEDAFQGCSRLTSITIPNSVTFIGEAAFYNCSNLTSVVSLADPAPTLDASISNLTFGNTHTSITLTVPFNAQGYTYNWGNANWQKIYHKINQGEIKPLSNTFEITTANKREVINKGVLVIEQGGELVNQTATNVGGIIEVKTKSLPNDKWSFIGAPFAGYKLESVVPGTRDISVSTFNYGTGAWSDEWSTIETQIGAGEGFFAWSYATEPTIFTNYGDGMYSPNAHSDYSDYNYDFNSTTNPVYQLNNGDVTVTKTLTTNGGNWMALANPYTFKLDVAKFLADQAACMEDQVQGKVIYKFDGTQFTTEITGAINVTEGFFVNFNHNGTHSATFKKSQRYTNTAKASVEREFVRLAMLDGEREIELLFAQNEQANEEYDIFDANKLFSPIEIAEPYFVVNNIELVKEEVNTLPYYATMNVKSYGNKEVTFKANYIPEGLAVSIIDGEETIDLGEGVEYTTNIIAGENADRFKVLIKKSLSISDAEELEVNIYNDNRHINIESLENDLQVEVYNALGQKVLSTTDRNFTLNQVSAGAYVVKAFNSKASKTQKVVVK